MARHDPADVWRLDLVPTGQGPDTAVRVRRLLKAALRVYGLRCVRVSGPQTEPKEEPEMTYSQRLELLSESELEAECRLRYTAFLALPRDERDRPQPADLCYRECLRRGAEATAMWNRVYREVAAQRAAELAARTPAPPALRDGADEIPS